MKCLPIVLLALAATTSAADENAGFANCDFEQGVAGWGVWYSDDRDYLSRVMLPVIPTFRQ